MQNNLRCFLNANKSHSRDVFPYDNSLHENRSPPFCCQPSINKNKPTHNLGPLQIYLLKVYVQFVDSDIKRDELNLPCVHLHRRYTSFSDGYALIPVGTHHSPMSTHWFWSVQIIFRWVRIISGRQTSFPNKYTLFSFYAYQV